MSDPIRWDVSMTQDGIGRFVSYHDYAMKDEQCEVLRARIAELEESLHLANGTAELAMWHRDIAEEAIAKREAVADELADLRAELAEEKKISAAWCVQAQEAEETLAKREAVPDGLVRVIREWQTGVIGSNEAMVAITMLAASQPAKEPQQ